jgi:hydroxyethylthiazole kinase-like uncharacterized protein yjeF
MHKVFKEVNTLDNICYNKYYLSEEILMENASIGMHNLIDNLNHKNQFKKILIVCGVGNNGADGLALARRLFKDFEVDIFLPMDVKTNMANFQLKIVNALGINIISNITLLENKYDLIVEAIFGTGVSRPLSSCVLSLINTLNSFDSIKIACDIPTRTFIADFTVTMGAYKELLFEDKIKDYLGKLSVANLGISRSIYEKDISTNTFILEQSDLKLPYRQNLQNTNKSTFGHICFISGQKQGAVTLSAKASLQSGAGLVTILCKNKSQLFDPLIMYSNIIPKNINTIALGMGLGEEFSDSEILEIFVKNQDCNFVIDADMFHKKLLKDILVQDLNIIITPHPKEFVSLLKILNIDDISVEVLQQNRFFYLRKFTKKFPNIGIILKGANMLISYKEEIFINSFGTSKLSKGGSGDVLAGIISALLAQGYDIKDSMINASLILTTSSNSVNKSDFSITALDIIDNIGKI